ncbi:MAG: hypothetical protein ABI743_08600 [bacterium]
MHNITTGFARHPQSGLLEVRAFYGGNPGIYLLDSAVGWDVLNLSQHEVALADEVAWHPVEVEGEEVDARTLEAKPFRIGQFDHVPDTVLALELPYTSSHGDPIHGMLGHPLFRETPIGIDWRTNSLTLGGSPPALEAIAELPLEVLDDRALVTLDWGGDAPLQLRLETAATMTMVLFEPGLALDEVLSSEEREARPADSTASFQFNLRRGRIGGFPVQDLAVRYEPQAKSPVQGLLGLGFLTHYRLWIDYPGERLTLYAR